MRAWLPAIALVLLGIVISSRLIAQPAFKPGPGMTATAAEIADIKARIANLKNIDQPDFGLSAAIDGAHFAPVPVSLQVSGGWLFIDNPIKTTDNVRTLVAYGPKALPLLLAALEDHTPTKLELKPIHELEGGMYFSNELPVNTNNIRELKAIHALPWQNLSGTNRLEKYRVKIGDVCFVIIGQIVGRDYAASRCGITAITHINSPVQNPELARQVRSVWTSTNVTQTLFDSLMLDYVATGGAIANGDFYQDVLRGLPSAAAVRLLYYFPDAAAKLIAGRLAKLDVMDYGTNWVRRQNRENANGVDTGAFIMAVEWSPVPEVRREIMNIFKRTTDASLLVAALPGLDANETNLIRARLAGFLDQMPANAEEKWYSADECGLLLALVGRFGEQAKPALVRYLQGAGSERWYIAIHILEEFKQPWVVDLLVPALNDQRESDEFYPRIPGQKQPQLMHRICDEAAEAISICRPDLKFQITDDRADRDRQITEIQKQIR